MRISALLIITTALLSCGNNKSGNNNNENKLTDSTSSAGLENNTINENDTLLASVLKINEWIKQFQKTDTIRRQYIYTDEYDEKWNIAVCENTEGDFNFIIIEDRVKDPFTTYSLNYDKNGNLCRMDQIEIRKGKWRDEVYHTWYMNEGNPFWLQEQHLYKEDYLRDTSYAPRPFTEDSHLMFFTKEQVNEHIRSLKSQ
jgi:hypothetical protein